MSTNKPSEEVACFSANSSEYVRPVIDGEWEVVVGIECHAQLAVESKLFSAAPLSFAEAPNTRVYPQDMASPGALPVLNPDAINCALITAIALNAKVSPESRFDRKHYMYADLPSGYQITQEFHPLASGGCLEIEIPSTGVRKGIELEGLKLEVDSGKTLHDAHPELSYVDLNRAGAALAEIVSTPTLYSAEEAAAYVRALQTLLRTVGTCDGAMEEGNLRCDVNVSVRHVNDPPEDLGQRVEVKNLNSVTSMIRAIGYETQRHIAAKKSGEALVLETRLWDVASGKTKVMRNKESAVDYRFFPDPDLAPLRVAAEEIERIRGDLPLLPLAQQDALVKNDGVTIDVARQLVGHPEGVGYFKAVVAAVEGSLPKKKVGHWITGDLLGLLRRHTVGGAGSLHSVSAESFGQLLSLVGAGTLSGRQGKEMLEMIVVDKDERAPRDIAAAEGWVQVQDEALLERLAREVVEAEPEKALKVLDGRKGLAGYFVGLVLKATSGQANPRLVAGFVKEAIDRVGEERGKKK